MRHMTCMRCILPLKLVCVLEGGQAICLMWIHVWYHKDLSVKFQIVQPFYLLPIGTVTIKTELVKISLLLFLSDTQLRRPRRELSECAKLTYCCCDLLGIAVSVILLLLAAIVIVIASSSMNYWWRNTSRSCTGAFHSFQKHNSEDLWESYLNVRS